MSMASISSTTDKDKQTSFPPKRGKIKAQIFGSLVKAVVSMVSGAGASSAAAAAAAAAAESSASVTPPPSSYNSDA
ncbi:hypothetical protein TIFTF001_000594 [Ficus carica]|uniref:Uncharacterized protein n=1 Tax=Ficus carica TaxID=3494 RepID=A0AA87YXX7_FICCA|nr:hypothetical protein TIFTF001_000594 [Ficus carica]